VRLRARGGLRSIERALAVFGFLVLVYFVAFNLSFIKSPSMAPTLRGDPANPDWVLSEKVTYRLRRPRRWETVLFKDQEIGVQIIKRVAGLPGETIALEGGGVRIDGTAIPRPESLGFLKYYSYGKLAPGKSEDCGRGYFLLGDDSKDSQDSRFEGPLAPERIDGRPWLIVWPRSRWGFVNP
jgi:signal peptidase I